MAIKKKKKLITAASILNFFEVKSYNSDIMNLMSDTYRAVHITVFETFEHFIQYYRHVSVDINCNALCKVPLDPEVNINPPGHPSGNF